MSHRWFAFALLALPLAGHGAGPAAVLEMSASGEVQIAPDGHVSDYRLTSELTPVVAKMVDRNVRGWEFEPVLVDGKAVLAKTQIHLRLRAEPDGKGDGRYNVRITNVEFGGPLRTSKLKPPRYPEEAVHAHLGARVLLALKVDEHGEVVDVQAYQTSLDARANSEREAESWRHVFERASLAAAKRWHFDLGETVDGKTIGTQVIVPLEFAVYDVAPPKSTDGRWKAYAPGPLHPAPWMNPSVAANADFSDLQNGEAKALDSPFHLKTSVIGAPL